MKKTASLCVLAAGTLWGMIGIFVRGLSEFQFTSMEIVALRAFLALLFLFAGLFLYDRELLRVRFRDLWCFAGTGLCSMVFFNYCYFKTIVLTSLSVAAVLLYTAPVIVTVLSALLFQEKLTVKKVLSLAMAFAGCVLVTGILSDASSLSAGGILTGLGAGLGYGLYSIFGRYALDRGYRSITVTAYTFLFAAVGCIPFTDVGHLARTLGGGPKLWIYAVALSLLCTVLPYILYTCGLSRLEAGTASVLATVEPAAASLIGVFLFGESIGAAGVLGIIFVLSSAVVLNLESRNSGPQNPGSRSRGSLNPNSPDPGSR